MATALEPGAEPEEITERELDSLGLNRIAYSIAISLKRLADATEEMTVAALAPQPLINNQRPLTSVLEVNGEPAALAAIKDAVDALAEHASSISTKTTSPEMAALAAKFINASWEDIGRMDPPEEVIKHIRSLAACVLSQTEPTK